MVEAPHAQLGLVQGCIPFRGRRRRCEVWGHIPNIWPPVACSLQFEVVSVRYRSARFVKWLRGAGVGGHRTGLHRLRPLSSGAPDIVFCDVGTLPAEHTGNGYWRQWAVVHVFFA